MYSNELSTLKDNLRQIRTDETFRFSCHPWVSCFGECCRKLRLMLTPYDILRLRKRLGLSSGEFIEKFTTMELKPPTYAPLLFLKMKEGSDGECPFLSSSGCSVYQDRPSACRVYPVARAVRYHGVHEVLMESFFLIKEDHCKGFEEAKNEWDIKGWLSDQGLLEYQRINDRWTKILMHPSLKGGLSEPQQQIFYVASYDMDKMKRLISSPKFMDTSNKSKAEIAVLMEDEFLLLDFSLTWLETLFFRKV